MVIRICLTMSNPAPALPSTSQSCGKSERRKRRKDSSAALPLATTYGTQWRKSQAPPTTTYAAEVEDSTIVGSVSFLTWKYMYCILSMYVMLNLCFAICWIVDLRPNWRFFALLSSQFPLLRVPWAFLREKKPGGGEKVFFSARNYLWSKHTQQWL